MKRKKLLLVTLIVGLLITLSPLAATAAPMPSPPSQKPECNPRAAFLSKWMGVRCRLLMNYQEDGVGFGVIMKAYFLSTVFPRLSWRRLVERHMSPKGLGWGQILQEHREGPGKPPWAQRGKPPWAGPHKPKD